MDPTGFPIRPPKVDRMSGKSPEAARPSLDCSERFTELEVAATNVCFRSGVNARAQ